MLAEFVISGMLIFARVGALLMVLPIFGTRGVPRQIPILIGIVVAMVLTPVLPATDPPLHLDGLLVSMLGEIALGLFLGLTVATIFAAFALGAEIMSHQMGMGLAGLFDPMIHAQQGAVATLASWMAAVVFVVSGLHAKCIEAIAWSFHHVPAGEAGLPRGSGQAMLEAVATMFSLGVQIAAPVLTLCWLINVFVAILTRMAPRMNLYFALGMTTSNTAGLILLLFSVPWMVQAHSEALLGAVEGLANLIRQVP